FQLDCSATETESHDFPATRDFLVFNHSLLLRRRRKDDTCGVSPDKWRSRTSGADRGNRQTDQKVVWLGVITGFRESGSIPIRSFTAPRSRCLQPRYFSVVCTDTCPSRN